MITQPSNRWYW